MKPYVKRETAARNRDRKRRETVESQQRRAAFREQFRAAIRAKHQEAA